MEVMIMLANRVQLQIKTKRPKTMIDQGWHQKGFNSQNFL